MPLSSGFAEPAEPQDQPTALIEGPTEAEVTSAVPLAPEIETPPVADEPPAEQPPSTVEIEVGSTEHPSDQTHVELQGPTMAEEPVRVEIEAPRTEGQSSVSRFVADTTWTATATFLELGPLHASVSTTTEALWQDDLQPADSTPEASSHWQSPTRGVRSVTVQDPGLPPEEHRRGQRKNLARPDDSRQTTESRPKTEQPGAEPELPSAKDILAAASQQASPLLEKQPGPTGRHHATPTISLQPTQWSAPLWLFWPPAVLMVLSMGITSFMLSWRWASDAFCASVIAQELLIPPTNPDRVKPLPESVVPPEPSWWRTTPLHLAHWGVYLRRPGREGDRTGEGRQLLEIATQLAPLCPVARLSRAELSARPGDSASLTRHLGLSRDAASLAWSARALRLAGRKEAAVRAYRQALQIACRCDLGPSAGLAFSPDLAFDDDSRVRRYYLPGEATAREILRELLADAGWSLRDWSEAVPRHTVAALAAARLLCEQERPEAQKLLKDIVASSAEDSQRGAELAIDMATRAEAHALLSQWREAQRQYQQAIDQVEDVTTKRCWWFNLASIALQLNDEAQRKAALQAAQEVTASDDISRRALELQRASQSLGRLRPGVTKAN
jgi:hypothetical protein